MTRTTSTGRRRNRLVHFGLTIAAAGVFTGAAIAPSVLAQTLPVQTAPVQTTSTAPQAQVDTTTQTLTVGATQALTLAVTEGPYFKANSPETTNLVQAGMQGTVLTVTGQVLDQNGQPVANALLDFWQPTPAASTTIAATPSAATSTPMRAAITR